MALWPSVLKPWVPVKWSCLMWWIWSPSWVPALHPTPPSTLSTEETMANMGAKGEVSTWLDSLFFPFCLSHNTVLSVLQASLFRYAEFFPFNCNSQKNLRLWALNRLLCHPSCLNLSSSLSLRFWGHRSSLLFLCFVHQAIVTRAMETLTSPTVTLVAELPWMTSCTDPSSHIHQTCPTASWPPTSLSPTACPTR